MTQAQKKERESRVTVIARDALRTAGGEVQRATKLMAKQVRANPALLRELMNDMIEVACYQEIGRLVRGDRAIVWTAPNYDKGGNGERVKALAKGNALMFFPLPGGVLLMNATRAEVLEASAFYGAQADNMSAKARWLALVAKACDGEKPVGKCLTEERLREFQMKAEQ